MKNSTEVLKLQLRAAGSLDYILNKTKLSEGQKSIISEVIAELDLANDLIWEQH
jgi:hypothetical protein